MTRFEVADRRIAKRERELAQLQFEHTPPQIDAKLAREALDHVLTTAAVMARTVCDALSIPIDEHLEQLGRDFVPKAKE